MVKTGLIVIVISVVVGGLFLTDIVPYIIGFFLSVGQWSPTEMRYSVDSTVDDRPVITFDQMSLRYSRHPFIVIEISEFDPMSADRYRKGEVTNYKRVWAIKNVGDWEKPLKSLTYGVCPPGFREVSRPQPLLTGHFYQVNASNYMLRKNGRCDFDVVPRSSIAK